MKPVAVVGASGYTGKELLRLLEHHPHLEAELVMTARPGVDPDEPGVRRLEPARFQDVAGVFLCTPHGTATPLVEAALAANARVVDLSADFRLKDAGVYRDTYEREHEAAELLDEAVYGLTEHARAALPDARLVANPGCYPTSILLPLLPLEQEGLLDESAPIVADSKSGVSGAGKQPNARTHFGNVHENFLAYGIGSHRHAPEIAQELGPAGDRLVFTPHLLPVFRGILSTIYVQPAGAADAGAVRECLRHRYAGEPFVRVHARGTPELRDVQRTNECHIAVHQSGPLVVITSAIDNLVKGASGQALQNMNAMLGLDEAEGLT